MAGRAAYGKLFGMVKQPNNDSNEFHIHNEDFPALPGSQGQENNQDSLSKQTSNASSESSKDSSSFSGDKVAPQTVKRGIQTSKDDYHVPSEYIINQSIRDKLAGIKLNRYGEDLLFFIFYMFGGDLLQLLSAAELYNRDWRFHKDERVWITRAGISPTEKTSTYERGTYFFFDPVNWRKVAKEFHLDYDRLEDRPQQYPPL
ncbi:hypothetical protein V5799_017925 [Amblyomma americanum]|uniref:NOT2/NOT3/NOT5 C-terminal domain-containing protein n=1 Tax=Amblyomma americanum TaxID=6943 RepID=A0AAQ4F0V8_AMBAM